MAAMTQNVARMLHSWRMGHLHNCDMGSRRITGRLRDIPVPLATSAGKFAPDPSETAPSAGVNADDRLHRMLRHLAAGAVGAKLGLAQPERARLRTSRAFCPRIFSRCADGSC